MELMHYGTPHQGYTPHSGRYKYGSGDNPFQREGSFLRDYRELKAQGYSDAQIADMRGMSISEFRAKRSLESAEEHRYNVAQAKRLKAKGFANQKIADILGASSEGTVRNWLKEGDKVKTQRTNNIAKQLEEQIKEKGCIDVGAGVELELNCSKEKLNAAILQLKEKGYETGNIWVDQVTNPKDNQKTTVRYLAMPGTQKSDLKEDLTRIKSISVYSPDGGDTFWVAERPSNLDSDRVFIRYAEDGGADKDGTIELRRNVKDISLGGASYAQVRIAVDGTHYMKGMAHYADDIPDGYDIVLNSNKKKGSTKDQVFKKLKEDPDNPFGANIKAQGQNYYEDKNGDYVLDGSIYRKATKKDKDLPRYSLSPVNLLKEEGDWDTYSKTLSSQFLSKQKESLIKTQLNQTFKENKEEHDSIMALTNPAVRKKLLETFAEQCDSSATDLKATALPRQATKVILPITTIKEDEVYAPSYRNGERLVLIRYPHAGTFEIPELVVNNNNKRGKDIIGRDASDAIGIHPKVAQRLSGADFDGDTVMAIPVNDKIKVTTSKPLKDLVGFEPKEAYGPTDQKEIIRTNKKTGEQEKITIYYQYGKPYKPMNEQTKQQQMGIVSNLITDMTLRGAPPEDLARAVKHSMVVIDAEKHHLNYKQSEKDNNIDALKRKYQKHPDGTYGGASTLISKSNATIRVPERELAQYKPDPETGKWVYKDTGRTYIDKKTGKEVQALSKVKAMMYTDDAYTLSSGHKKETLYAEYANKMKALANQSRMEAANIKAVPKSPTAVEVYKEEADSLGAKLKIAKKNAPKERAAQLIANQVVRTKLKEYPDIDKEHEKKMRQQEIQRARARVGANKKSVMVEITPKEWEAIQAGAISTTKLTDILNNTDLDVVRKYATPRDARSSITDAKRRSIEAKLNTGRYTIAEIAEAEGVSVSTVSKINRKDDL